MLFKSEKMKIKIFASILLSALLMSLGFSAQCAENVSFYAEDAVTDNNRIFTLAFCGKGEETLSAVKFVITYDNSTVDFRDASVLSDKAKLDFNSEEGCLSIIYLNQDGVDLSHGEELFTVDFKAENITEETTFDFSVFDCVTNTLDTVPAQGGSCKALLASSSANSSAGTKKTAKASSSVGTAGKSSQALKSDDSLENSKDDNGTENLQKIQAEPEKSQSGDGEIQRLSVSKGDNYLSAFICGGVIMFVLLAVSGISYHIGRKRRRSGKDENE